MKLDKERKRRKKVLEGNTKHFSTVEAAVHAQRSEVEHYRSLRPNVLFSRSLI